LLDHTQLFKTMGSACVKPRDGGSSTPSANAKDIPSPEPSANAKDIPSPEELLAKFETMDFAAQPFADEMFKVGRQPKSDVEKVWRSRYTYELLVNATVAAKPIIGEDAQTIKILEGMLPLTETIVYDSDRWYKEVVPKYQAAVDALDGAQSTPEVEQLRGMILKVGTTDLFYSEVQNPKQDFYMVLMDDMHAKFSNGKRDVISVSQESLRMMHSIDMLVHQKKSDMRRDCIVGFFTRLYQSNYAGHAPWKLDELLEQHGDEAEQKALHSETPLLSFALDELEPTYPGYVLMEGSGRLAALNAALDVVREKHPDFVAPEILIMVMPFEGPPLARKNLNFFLALTWKCTFPAVEIAGWQCQVSESFRPVDDITGGPDYKGGADAVRARPRYFGYFPHTTSAVIAGGG